MTFLHTIKSGLVLIFALILFACSSEHESKIKLHGKTMGTTYNISLVALPSKVNVELLQRDIDEQLKMLNQIASTYIPDSELSLFNRSGKNDPKPISDSLKKMFLEAIRLAQLTDGLLDVTVGPLVNLWGFGPTQHAIKIPNDEQIMRAKGQVGIQHIVIDGQLAYKTNPDIYVDLSTLAKGYGVDAIANLLAKQGLTNYLVEIGGEIRVSGTSVNNKDWKIAIEKPIDHERAVQRIIEPMNNAVATSGDYRIYFEENNTRYSHLINPKTGKPITHKMVSTTVIHPSCMVADGLATGFMIMGPEKALALANKESIAALFISKNEQGEFVETYSNAFAPFIK